MLSVYNVLQIMNAGPILSMFKFITTFKQRSPDLSMDFRSVDNGFKQLHEYTEPKFKVATFQFLFF